jgi:hypothetical protein
VWVLKNLSTENIQSVGSSDFKRRCSELAKEVDQTYKKLLPTQQGRIVLSQGCLQNSQPEPHLHNGQVSGTPSERRKFKLLDSLMMGHSPPLQQNTRFPVSDDDIINYSSIVELAHSGQHKK